MCILLANERHGACVADNVCSHALGGQGNFRGNVSPGPLPLHSVRSPYQTGEITPFRVQGLHLRPLFGVNLVAANTA